MGKGMRAKPPKLGQIEKAKRAAADDAFDKSVLLFALAARDEFGLGSIRLCRLLERVDRYAGYVQNKAVELREVQEIIEKGTGMAFRGW